MSREKVVRLPNGEPSPVQLDTTHSIKLRQAFAIANVLHVLCMDNGRNSGLQAVDPENVEHLVCMQYDMLHDLVKADTGLGHSI